MNKVILVGYLAKDPVQKITRTGIEQSTFSIGVNDFKNFEETYFFNCVAWNSTAKYINNNLVKGQLVTIDGRLITRSYLNAENKKVYITEIIADSIKAYGTIKKHQAVENTFVQNSTNMQSIDNQQIYDVNNILNDSESDNEMDDLEDDGLIDWGN